MITKYRRLKNQLHQYHFLRITQQLTLAIAAAAFKLLLAAAA
jgi:hypothetical protein